MCIRDRVKSPPWRDAEPAFSSVNPSFCLSFVFCLPRFLVGSLRFDDGNVNDNATNQWFDWLNEEKQSCCTCGTLFAAMFWRSLPNDDVKFSHLRFRRQRELVAEIFHSLPLHENHSYQASESALRLFCTTRSKWNNRKRLNLTQSSILMWCFRCSCRCSFLNSLERA